MSSTPMGHRIFAGAGAVLFAFLCLAALFPLILDMNKNKDATDPTAQQSQAQKETVLAAPEVYKTETKVTEVEKTDLTTGTGATAKDGDVLVMKYYGTLANEGTMFDENYTKDTAFTFQLGTGQVIKGWDQGLVGMKVGGERRLVIPASLAYGETGQGSIPPNADLVFVVKLLRIQK